METVGCVGGAQLRSNHGGMLVLVLVIGFGLGLGLVLPVAVAVAVVVVAVVEAKTAAQHNCHML